jgi:CheY-like chemotaxis protein
MSVRALRIDGEDCFLFTYRDITEHKRMQAEAARAQNEKAAAEAANRAKTDFLSRMSHELRTPLNAVLGFSQLLMSDRAERLSERQTTQLEVIQQAGWHLLALINDVLDVSRIEAGRLNLSARPIALTELLDEVVTLVLPQAQRWGVTIATDYRARPPLMVNSDPVRMRQIMLNVITNAVKYNRAGGTAHVDVSQQAQRARVTVADTGLGMTRDQLEHLFEPFNRLGRERSGIEGTGIGMALTRQLLQLMDGTIEVRSEAGVGTQVLIGFPAAAASAAEPRSAASGNDARPTSALPAATRCKGTVLYIEDNPVNQTVVQQMLARWPDLRLVLAGNGERGIALARELRPDLVLLDMRLPDLNGCQVLDALRGDPQTRELAVVALSASAMPEEVAAARASGALEYWTKPLDLAGFLAGVQRLLAPAVA